jgi:regulatory protein
VVLARQYIARKRIKQPSGADAQKETVRVMNRLMRAGFSSNAIFKVLRAWNLPEEVMPMEGGADSDSYAERDDDDKDEQDLPEF